MNLLATRLRRLLAKPPGYLARRAAQELRHEADRWFAPRRGRRFDAAALLQELGDAGVEQLWQRLQSQAYPFCAGPVTQAEYDARTGGDSARILAAAQRALEHRVDLLGTGPVDLGACIDWQLDYKSGIRFADGYFRDIDYARLDEPCDVKIPWEISRCQWLIPAAQAWLLTGEERYAAGCREVLEQWMAANPYAFGVNWACTMEAAMRIFTWTWLFRACAHSSAWADAQFRERFLCALYLHADFTERYIERSDVNGNHFTADAAALVFAGLFFLRGAGPRRWLSGGWRDLSVEMQRQVFADGVDFEASVPYHRLVQELFLLPALYRRAAGQEVDPAYLLRLARMAEFTAAYSRADGTTPLWGDNDDARTLPFGGQPPWDHRYLVQVAALFLERPDLARTVTADGVEAFWLLGRTAPLSAGCRPAGSASFSAGGFFVMRNEHDHVFIDCGPIGLAGRGGHGHNDLLAFEAQLDGERLITDSGAYVYTGDPTQRNLFRSTAYHSTPMVDGEEINRFIGPGFLWNLHDDARFEVKRWSASSERDEFNGLHSGYHRLADPVTVERSITLDHRSHVLTVTDHISGRESHRVATPFHLAPQISVTRRESGALLLRGAAVAFELSWEPAAWRAEITTGRESSAYGVASARQVVLLSFEGALPAILTVTIRPVDS